MEKKRRSKTEATKHNIYQTRQDGKAGDVKRLKRKKKKLIIR